MTKQYLVFDSGCSTCTHIAHAIQEVVEDKLEVISHNSEIAHQLLTKSYPDGWEHQPYLILAEGEKVQAHSGLRMRFELVRSLGIKKGWLIWRIAQRHGVSLPNTTASGFSRRKLLKNTGVATLAAVAAPNLWAKDLEELLSASTGKKLQIRPLEGLNLQQSIKQILNETDVELIVKHFEKRSFHPLEEAKITRVSSEENEALVFTQIFETKGGDRATLTYLNGDTGTQVEAGIYRIEDGQVTHLNVVEVKEGRVSEKEVMFRDKQGNLTSNQSDVKRILDLDRQKRSSTEWSDCDICRETWFWVNAISCATVTGVTLCRIVCAPIGNVSCIYICPLVFLIMCSINGWANEALICGNWCCDERGGCYCHYCGCC